MSQGKLEISVLVKYAVMWEKWGDFFCMVSSTGRWEPLCRWLFAGGFAWRSRGVAAEMGSEIRVRKLTAKELNVARLNVKTRKLKVQENFLSLWFTVTPVSGALTSKHTGVTAWRRRRRRSDFKWILTFLRCLIVPRCWLGSKCKHLHAAAASSLWRLWATPSLKHECDLWTAFLRYVFFSAVGVGSLDAAFVLRLKWKAASSQRRLNGLRSARRLTLALFQEVTAGWGRQK